MRELTKKEKKAFDIFIKGYCEGLRDEDARIGTFAPDSNIIELNFKHIINILSRNKENYKQFHKGYTAGYFRAMSSPDKAPIMLDPEMNDDIYEYLKSVWLHEQVYGGEADAGSEQV